MSIVSHHMLRRTARARAHRLNAQDRPHVHYRVEPTQRGPWRYRVIRDNTLT